MKRTIATIAALVALVISGSTVEAKDRGARVAPDLQQMLNAGQASQRVIVTYANGEVATQEVDFSRPFAGRSLRLDGKLRASRSGAAGKADLQQLINDPNVVSISPDRRIFGNFDVTAEAAGATAVTENLGLTGNGVTVAIIDTGITPSENVSADRILASVDFTGGNNPLDTHGHGTHIAGIVGGTLNGLATDVNFVSLKALDGEGAGYASSVIQAIEWAIYNKDAYGIRVINMSLGHPVFESYTTDPMNRAVQKAWDAGLLVVTSAGNRGRDGYVTINTPGNDPYVLTVGAMNDLNTVERADDISATYSSKGPTPDFAREAWTLKPDLVAPGNRIGSTMVDGSVYAEQFPDRVVGNGMIEMSGSSMAAGVGSATAALMLELNPNLTPDQLKATMMLSSERLDSEDIFTAGAGYLDAARAIAHTGPWKSVRFNSASPSFQIDDAGEVSMGLAPALNPMAANNSDAYGIAIAGSSATSAAAWDNATLLNQQPLWSNSQTWLDRSLLGENSPWGGIVYWVDTALWTDVVYWVDTALWSDAALWSDHALSSDIAYWTDMVYWVDTALWTDIAYWVDSAVNPNTAYWVDTALWTDGATWGDIAYWTDTALWTDAAYWVDAALWSDTALWTDTALWSDTALWTDAALWSDAFSIQD